MKKIVNRVNFKGKKMPVTQIWIYTWPEGTTPILFQDWISTLPQAEQDEYALANARQLAFRQQVIDEGVLELSPINSEGTDIGYTWIDQEAADIGKPTDPTWYVYWNRWINETGVQVTVDVSEI